VATRDRRFGTSARTVLAALPHLAVVVITLPQARAEYLSAFSAAWERQPIDPVAGAIVEWP
jgi:hypothetical protein